MTIELPLRFDFDHETPKLVIIAHPTYKTVHIWPLDGFAGGFVDLDATWWWDQPVSPPLSSLLFSSFSLLSYLSPLILHRPPPSPTPLQLARLAALAHGGAAAHSSPDQPRCTTKELLRLGHCHRRVVPRRGPCSPLKAGTACSWCSGISRPVPVAWRDSEGIEKRERRAHRRALALWHQHHQNHPAKPPYGHIWTILWVGWSIITGFKVSWSK